MYIVLRSWRGICFPSEKHVSTRKRRCIRNRDPYHKGYLCQCFQQIRWDILHLVVVRRNAEMVFFPPCISRNVDDPWTGGHWAISTPCSHPMTQLHCWASHLLMALWAVWLTASPFPFVNFSSSVCVKVLNTTLHLNTAIFCHHPIKFNRSANFSRRKPVQEGKNCLILKSLDLESLCYLSPSISSRWVWNTKHIFLTGACVCFFPFL